MLGSVAGLEVALREHLGGYRSHSLILSGVAAIASIAVLFFAGVDRATLLPVAVVVFAVAFAIWRAVFKRRSGGVGFRVR
jgi:TRAP-type C4-dicarboxylate transport system permease large subunit